MMGGMEKVHTDALATTRYLTVMGGMEKVHNGALATTRYRYDLRTVVSSLAAVQVVSVLQFSLIFFFHRVETIISYLNRSHSSGNQSVSVVYNRLA